MRCLSGAGRRSVAGPAGLPGAPLESAGSAAHVGRAARLAVPPLFCLVGSRWQSAAGC
jgi:hypothetical protein